MITMTDGVTMLIHLGSFLTAAEAVAARRSAERENFGEECPR